MLDYFASYLQYAGAGQSEPPIIFHRWTAASIVGALLGRQAYIPFGHSKIYPNQFIMFMGSPGSRKSTAINIGAKLLKAQGYSRFASDKTSKERFLMDMRTGVDEIEDEDALLDLSLDEPSEIFVVAEEFTDFIGEGNTEFATMLTKLWDNPDEYKHPKIHGKSVEVSKPTVNILSGNTPANFVLAFPQAAMGNGFLSRILLVHGDTTGRKVTFPAAPDPILKEGLIHHLKQIRNCVSGEVIITEQAKALCESIYTEFTDLDDARFKSYNTRRFTHLLKLAMIMAAVRLSSTIDEEDILKANTMLHITEVKMPKALGEFGKSKFSDVTHNILDILEHAHKPVTMKELWQKVSKDLNKFMDLAEIIKGLIQAERIQQLTAGKTTGFLPLRKAKSEWKDDRLMLEWMTEEEVML